MIDTGAPYIMLPVDIMQRLGLSNEIREDKQIVVEGIVSGGKSLGVFHDIVLEVQGETFNTYACFTTEVDIALLGIDGFFNLFEVRIDYINDLIELKPY